MRNAIICVLLSLGVSACGSSPAGPSGTGNNGGGGGGGTTPTNHNPTITSLTVGSTSGVSQLSSFSMQASASDPDGDTISYAWNFGDGATAAGTSATHIFNGSGGSVVVTLTVTDSKGAATSDTRTVTIGSMAGTWIMDIPSFVPIQLDLQQSGGTVTGTFVQLKDGFSTPKGTTGKTDPAEPGKIDANGKVEIRLKVGRFLDFYMRGTMDATGRTIRGGLFNSGFGGDEFTATKQ